jgi:hypothetical protein
VVVMLDVASSVAVVMMFEKSEATDRVVAMRKNEELETVVVAVQLA